MSQPEISVVIPAFNEAESLPELADWLNKVLTQNGLSYEVIAVDDGSTDETWEVIQALGKKYSEWKGLSFRRNYGKSAALDAGFRATTGKVVVTMDADLQDSPDELPELYRLITEENYQLVSGWKRKRYDPIMKTAPSKLFNYVTSKMSGIKLHDFNCGLKAYKGEVARSLSIYGEMHRYIPVIAKWQGYKRIGEKVVEHRARKYGVTKFGLERFIYGFLDLLSIMFVSKFSRRPMHFFGSLGTISFLIGFAITFYLLVEKVYFNLVKGLAVRQVTDQPLFFLSLLVIVLGVQLFLAGFLGEMMTNYNRKNNDYQFRDKIGLE